MVVLKAYVDESGFDGPLFALAGFVAPEDAPREHAQWLQSQQNEPHPSNRRLELPTRFRVMLR
jgi:hypothetical protein